MPRLDSKTAKAVESTEAAGGFEPVPEGEYYASLMEVNAKQGQNGPYWQWAFVIPSSAEEYAGRRFWTNTSLGESSRPFMKRMFDAFGVPADTDTDLLLGRKVKLRIKQVIIPVGTRAGETGNEIALVSAYDGPEEEEGDDGIPF